MSSTNAFDNEEEEGVRNGNVEAESNGNAQQHGKAAAAASAKRGGARAAAAKRKAQVASNGDEEVMSAKKSKKAASANPINDEESNEASASAAAAASARRAPEKDSRSVYNNPHYKLNGEAAFEGLSECGEWKLGFYLPSVLRRSVKSAQYVVREDESKPLRKFEKLEDAVALLGPARATLNRYRRVKINGEACVEMEMPVSPKVVLKEDRVCTVLVSEQTLERAQQHAWEMHIESDDKVPYVRSTHDVLDDGTLRTAAKVQRMKPFLGIVHLRNVGDEWAYRDMRTHPDAKTRRERVARAAATSVMNERQLKMMAQGGERAKSTLEKAMEAVTPAQFDEFERKDKQHAVMHEYRRKRDEKHREEVQKRVAQPAVGDATHVAQLDYLLHELNNKVEQSNKMIESLVARAVLLDAAQKREAALARTNFESLNDRIEVIFNLLTGTKELGNASAAAANPSAGLFSYVNEGGGGGGGGEHSAHALMADLIRQAPVRQSILDEHDK